MKVKDLMTPVGDYLTLGADATLGEAVVALKEGKHRDIFILDGSGDFIGVLTMTDILTALEPNYKKLSKKDLDTDILSNRVVAEQFKEFNLWADTLSNICARGVEIKVADAMHVPEASHYIDENNDLEHGLHMYMVGTPQPLIVRDKGTITGVLRLSDIFNELTNQMRACALGK
ncbi:MULTISPECIES: CBS domain-containing protein [unclassified Pseudodesulfovibrio]|uniref:CBS domain-containing protein n=1 Tax=unclassified Pseudodesulfovibrio TaxID=2661612 RepID=UPI000FEB7594|nr:MULTISPECIES: CBS domain-containing protein [unclassified Pseudodesulfovibrio]MCJ2165008.1 CBS domain-containing protein [Pseudodesulfovibrio sp. S3-i]RWU03552.1 CBS domain-containing protein [Pseudodesulfovibrio sp. S3]